MKNYNYVYKITNLVNGKIYIGKHSTDNLDDGYIGSGVRLRQAYKKYGLECFSKEVMLFYTSEEELNRGEIYWIARFNSTDPEIGYNLTYGGDGCIATIEARRKMSENRKGKGCGENNGMYGKTPANKGVPMSEEQKRKIGEANKISLKGNRVSEETKRKISESLKGKPNGRLGKKHSNETKQKISLARKLYWQKRKLAKLNQQNNG